MGKVMEETPTAKLCIYCGANNSMERSTCLVCHNAFVSEEEIARVQDEFFPVSHPPNVSRLALSFEDENGFSYPDWKKVREQLLQTVPKEDWWDVYHELAKQWLLQLKADLGGNYRCYESEDFLFLCDQGAAASRTILGYAEGALASLQKQCGKLLVREAYGKRVILVFSDPDDYYAYISHFHTEGAHSLSSGMMLSGGGYLHIAFPLTWVFSTKGIITHELVHNCIAHLRVPTWLHEGLAQKLERVALGRGFNLDRELAARHYALWNEDNIQEFWSGASFYGPDERNTLSYSLALILVELLANDWKGFLEFVSEADYRDAGQDAAVRVLERCLGETIGGFLGPGNWRPHRKAIAEDHRSMRDRKNCSAATLKLVISTKPEPSE